MNSLKRFVKSFLPLLFISIFFFGCITTQKIASHTSLKIEELRRIPKGTSTILATSNQSADSTFQTIKSILFQRGHRIQNVDKKMRYISTEGHEIGYSTLQRMTINVNKQANGCSVDIRTEWKPGAGAPGAAESSAQENEWQKAYWSSGRPNVALAESYAICNNLKTQKISFK
jgi:hypothetical protein